MTSSTTNRALWRGTRDSLPFIFVAGPFGLLFGVVASEAGLHLIETFTFSLSVFAGAAQFTAMTLMQEHAPTLIVLVSALAVNLRCAMYSAALTPHLGGAPMWKRALGAFFIVDQSYALSIVEFETLIAACRQLSYHALALRDAGQPQTLRIGNLRCRPC